MKRRILLLILVVVAVAVAARMLWTARLARANANRLLVSGNIELTQVDISFKVPGKLIERTVDEGAPVTKGMLIARIDRDQVEQQHSRDEAAMHAAQTQLQQTETSVEWQKATVADDIALKKAQVKEAQARLDALLAGSRPQEIQQARAAVVDARAQNEQAKLDWDRAQELFKNDDISKAQYDQFRARNDSTNAAFRQAEERLALVVEGPRKEDIEAARAQVATAQAALRMSQANELEVKRREQEVLTQLAEVNRSRAQMQITQSQINDTTVYSPIDGVVLVKSAEVGEVLAAGTSVVTIGDLDHPWLRAYINETDLGRVKLGATAKLTTDSYSGRTYSGRVSFIASEAEFTPKQIQTPEERVKLVYRIKIEVDNPKHELKTNMPVDAEIALN
jgi:HlyD family secretion protein